MALGKTTFSDIAAHQRDDLFADAICGEVPSEPTFRQRLGVIAAISGVRDVVDDLNLDLLRRAKDFGTVRTPSGTYMPLDMDVYALAVTCCVGELTEISATHRSKSVDIPDYTRGAWKTNKPLDVVDIDLVKFGLKADKIEKAADQMSV